MSTIQEIIGIVRGYAREVQLGRMPPRVEVAYPADHPLAGLPAGDLLLRADAQGWGYGFHATPRDEPPRRTPLAEVVRGHEFSDLESLYRYAQTLVRPVVFVAGDPFGPATARLLIGENEPQYGQCTLVYRRHPAWERWTAVIGRGAAVEVTHEELGDLLLDNQEDLDDDVRPGLVATVRALRSVRTITYDVDLETGTSVGVRGTLRGRGGREGAETDVVFPREITARVPAYVGAWRAGEEPRHRLALRLRVVAPSDEDEGVPRFRILWHDALGYEHEAREELRSATQDRFHPVPVYAGLPRVQRYVVPEVP